MAQRSINYGACLYIINELLQIDENDEVVKEHICSTNIRNELKAILEYYVGEFPSSIYNYRNLTNDTIINLILPFNVFTFIEIEFVNIKNWFNINKLDLNKLKPLDENIYFV